MNYHKILERQLEKYLRNKDLLPEIESLLQAIDESYRFYDRDRELLERAMELSSTELTEANQKIRDELEQKKVAQEKILESEQIFKSINQNLSEAIYRTSLDGTLIFVNKAFAELFGYDSIEEIMKLPAKTFYYNKGDRTKLVTKLIKESGVKNIEVLFRKKDGSQFWALLNSILSYDSKGNRFVDGAVVDITTQKVTEERLRSANELLQKTNEELDRFVYSASHDLRAPLMSLLGLIRIMELENSAQNIEEYLQMMRKSILKLDSFIRDIVDYSQNSRQETRPQEINFPELLDESFDNFQYLELSPRIRKITDCSINAPFFSDTRRLKVIFNNLIGNAISYHNINAEDPYIRVMVKTSHAACSIQIEDNGMGIDSHHLDKIFNMFYRGTTYSKGSGLGLYITKETLNKLGGTIDVNSDVGKGTTFSILIPNMEINGYERSEKFVKLE